MFEFLLGKTATILATGTTLLGWFPIMFKIYEWYRKPNLNMRKYEKRYKIAKEFFADNLLDKHPFEVESFYMSIFGKNMTYPEIMYCLEKSKPTYFLRLVDKTRLISIEISGGQPRFIGFYKKYWVRKVLSWLMTIIYFVFAISASLLLMLSFCLLSSLATKEHFIFIPYEYLASALITSLLYTFLAFVFSYLSLNQYWSISFAEYLVKEYKEVSY